MSPSTPDAGPELSSKKVSTACTACQNRKSKCTGGVPCHKCRARGTECLIDESTDGRRKQALKRKQQAWEDDKTLLVQMVEALRDSDERYVNKLIGVIRSDASLESIRLYINGRMHEAEASASVTSGPVGLQTEVSRPRGGRDTSSPWNVMDMHRLVDSPFINVTADPWTTVTNDNHLVSHLVSMWFTWSAPWQNWIDQKLFIRDMQSENVDAQYCSPFLVNAMLAHACPYSDYPEVKAPAYGMSDMMEKFLAEAKRLLDREAGKATLVTLQGLGILYQCVASMGKDRQSWTYLRQIEDMVSELSQASSFPDYKPNNSTKTSNQAFAYAWWGLWIATTTSCLTWHKPPVMSEPTWPKPELVIHGTQSDAWLPYPKVKPAVPGHAACLFDAYCILMPIVTNTIKTVLVGREATTYVDLESNVLQLHLQLETWHQNLPPCLAISQEVPFQILFPHFYYRYMIIVLFSCLKSTSSPYTQPIENVQVVNTARALCLESALQIVNLLKVQRTSCSVSHICDSTIHWAAIALFTLLDEDLHLEAHRTAFVWLCDFTWSVGQRRTLGKGILRLVQLTARERQKNTPYAFLPLEAEKLLGDFEYAWRNPDSLVGPPNEISSFYPNFTEFIQGIREQYGLVDNAMTLAEVNNALGALELPPATGSRRVVEMDKFFDMYDQMPV